VGERRPSFLREVGEGLAADVDDDPLDGASDERPRSLAGVVVGDLLGPRSSDREAAAAEPELAGLVMMVCWPTFSSRM
jgi:hypothetical protein